MSVDEFVRFFHRGQPYYLLFCHRCGSEPIIVAENVFDRINEAKLAELILCTKCGKRKKPS